MHHLNFKDLLNHLPLAGINNQSTLWADPDLTGYLEKRGGRFNTWKRRFFLLQGNFLFYFLDHLHAETSYPLGLIPIDGSTIKEGDPEEDEKHDKHDKHQHIFGLFLGKDYVGFAKHATYVLAADSHDSLREWMLKLADGSDSRDVLLGKLRKARTRVGELRHWLSESKEDRALLAATRGPQAVELQTQFAIAYKNKEELRERLLEASAAADQQEASKMQEYILWDILQHYEGPPADHNHASGHSQNATTSSMVQNEIQLIEELYQILLKKHNLFHAEGLGELNKEARKKFKRHVKHILDNLQDQQAKIRARAPRYSFMVDPKIYDDDLPAYAGVYEPDIEGLDLLKKRAKRVYKIAETAYKIAAAKIAASKDELIKRAQEFDIPGTSHGKQGRAPATRALGPHAQAQAQAPGAQAKAPRGR